MDLTSETLVVRFWAKVEKTEGCWLWTGAVRGTGYGNVSLGGRGRGLQAAHRVSWELHNGPILDGLCVLHACDVRNCVRPDHLFLGTILDNNRDAKAKGRNNRGERVPSHKLSTAEAIAVRASTGPLGETAAEYGISKAAVSMIRRGLRWGHLTVNGGSLSPSIRAIADRAVDLDREADTGAAIAGAIPA